MDIRLLMNSYASSIRLLCENIHHLVKSTTKTSLANSIHTPLVKSRTSVETEISNLVTIISKNSPELVADAIDVCSMGVISQLFTTGLATNARAYIESNINNASSLTITTYEMEDGSLCYCLPGSQCPSPAAIYSSTRSTTYSEILSVRLNKTVIKGMKTDCFPYDGLAASTLECYYDASCIQSFVANGFVFEPLNASWPSKFRMTSPLREILQSGLVEEFSYNYSIERYYEECSPQLCIYSYVHLNTPLTIISTIISVLSGLNTGLRLILLKGVSIFLILKKRILRFKCKRVGTSTTVVERGKVLQDIVKSEKRKHRNLMFFREVGETETHGFAGLDQILKSFSIEFDGYDRH